MDLSELEKRLNDSLAEYSKEVRSKYPETSVENAEYSDIHDLSREVFYVLNDFKKAIIEYLK